MVLLIFIAILIENSVSKPWRPCSENAVPDLDFHCSSLSHKKETRLMWVNAYNFAQRRMILPMCLCFARYAILLVSLFQSLDFFLSPDEVGGI